MKNLSLRKNKTLRSLTALAAVLVFASMTVLGAPTKRLFGGSTTVALSSEFIGAASSLGLSVRTIIPGRTTRRTRVSFPVVAGNIDLETARGEIIHSGGLQISNQMTTVKLSSFIIDTTGDAAVLTGLVEANGSVVARIPLFKLQLPPLSLPLPDKNGRLEIPDVGVLLTAEAAAALNQVFGVEAFVEDFNIGTAHVGTIAFD